MKNIVSWRSLWRDFMAFGPLRSDFTHKLAAQVYLRPMDLSSGYPQSWVLFNRGVRVARILNTNEYELFEQPAYNYILNTINNFTPVVAKRDGLHVVIAPNPSRDVVEKLANGMIFDDHGLFIGKPQMINGRLIYPSSRRDILKKFNPEKMKSLISHDAETVRTVADRQVIPAGYTRESWERAVSDMANRIAVPAPAAPSPLDGVDPEEDF